MLLAGPSGKLQFYGDLLPPEIMPSFILRCAITLCAFSSSAARAQSDEQIWLVTSANVKLGDKWRLSEEIVARFSDQRHGLYEIELNTLVGRVIGKGVTVWAGYTHDPQYAGGHFTIMEHRAREQVTFDNLAQLGRGKLSGRLRVEERWRHGVDGTGWRVRPYLKYALPVHGKVALNLSAEPFFNLNRTGFQKQSGLDRVRSLISLSVPLSKRLTGEAGYMN